MAGRWVGGRRGDALIAPSHPAARCAPSPLAPGRTLEAVGSLSDRRVRAHRRVPRSAHSSPDTLCSDGAVVVVRGREVTTKGDGWRPRLGAVPRRWCGDLRRAAHACPPARCAAGWVVAGTLHPCIEVAGLGLPFSSSAPVPYVQLRASDGGGPMGRFLCTAGRPGLSTRSPPSAKALPCR